MTGRAPFRRFRGQRLAIRGDVGPSSCGLLQTTGEAFLQFLPAARIAGEVKDGDYANADLAGRKTAANGTKENHAVWVGGPRKLAVQVHADAYTVRENFVDWKLAFEQITT